MLIAVETKKAMGKVKLDFIYIGENERVGHFSFAIDFRGKTNMNSIYKG